MIMKEKGQTKKGKSISEGNRENLKRTTNKKPPKR